MSFKDGNNKYRLSKTTHTVHVCNSNGDSFLHPNHKKKKKKSQNYSMPFFLTGNLAQFPFITMINYKSGSLKKKKKGNNLRAGKRRNSLEGTPFRSGNIMSKGPKIIVRLGNAIVKQTRATFSVLKHFFWSLFSSILY